MTGDDHGSPLTASRSGLEDSFGMQYARRSPGSHDGPERLSTIFFDCNLRDGFHFLFCSIKLSMENL